MGVPECDPIGVQQTESLYKMCVCVHKCIHIHIYVIVENVQKGKTKNDLRTAKHLIKSKSQKQGSLSGPVAT